jgi:phage shock protein PspC (stress-responsive transcriptional regulator)
MTRLLENRILGGVCSGLGRSTPISAWIWRIIWLALIPLTGGTAILLYAMWWWTLPEQSFNDLEVGRFLRTIAVIVFSVIVLGGWFGRENFISETGADLYIPIVLILTAGVFLLQQFDRHPHARNNPVLGIVMLAVSSLPLMNALCVPFGIMDIVNRGLPAILIFLGLSIILRERIPIGGLIALAVSLALPFVIATVAISSRVGQVLDDNVVVVEQPIADDSTQLTLDLSALTSDVEIRTGTQDGIVIAEFTGSTEHTLQSEFAVDDQNFAILVLDEIQDSAFASFTAIGRGTIDVQLPPDFPVFIKLDVADGNVTLNLRDLDLLSIESLAVSNGNALVTLPAYNALSPSAQDSGLLNVFGGSLTLFVPENLGTELFLNQANNSRPIFDDLLYLLEDRGSEWRLGRRDFDTLPIKTSYIVSAPSGTVTVEVLE